MNASNVIIGALHRPRSGQSGMGKLCGLNDGEELTPELVTGHLHQFVIPENPYGFSFDCIRWTCYPSVPPDSYFLSIRQCGQRWEGLPTFYEVLAWVSLNLSNVFEVNGFIGGWPREGFYWLDVTIAVQGWERANLIAWKQKQIEIYNFDAGDSIPVVEPRIRLAI